MDEEVLGRIQANFHDVIRSRAAQLIERHNIELPILKYPLENDKEWFAVPGMYGGFSYWFEADGEEIKLITESWCRVVGGSGQRHEVTSDGYKLVDEGFV